MSELRTESVGSVSDVPRKKSPVLCACKGMRCCLTCKDSSRVRRNRNLLNGERFSEYRCMVYDSESRLSFADGSLQWDATAEEIYNSLDRKKFEGGGTLTHGILLINDFLSADAEQWLVERIDAAGWAPSQSGRRKQDYGPRVNFKARKINAATFVGLPDYIDLLLEKIRLSAEKELANFHPIELCNLEYCSSRQSSIDFHKDDSWVWGERLISINCLSDSVLTLEDPHNHTLFFVPMPQRSLICLTDEARYTWNHGIFFHHIGKRRIVTTLREISDEFLNDEVLYDSAAKELLEISRRRIVRNEI